MLFFMGKLTPNQRFSIAMLVIARGYTWKIAMTLTEVGRRRFPAVPKRFAVKKECHNATACWMVYTTHKDVEIVTSGTEYFSRIAKLPTWRFSNR